MAKTASQLFTGEIKQHKGSVRFNPDPNTPASEQLQTAVYLMREGADNLLDVKERVGNLNNKKIKGLKVTYELIYED